MAVKVEIRVSESGLRKILASPEMARACGQVAEQIAERARAAGIRVEHEPGDIALPIETHEHIGGGGAPSFATVVSAHPSGAAVEAKHRLLGRSV